MRGCREPLKREERRLVCPRNHSFDIARSGYVNLLQPQDKKSKQPGDSAEAVAARQRLHDRGVSAPLLKSIADAVAPRAGERILDAGCGNGFYLASLAREAGAEAHGVDISIPAVNAAAKRYPEFEWIVGNADRFVPYEDASFDIVLSVTGRMNSAEFRRVLRADGRLLVAIPAPDDLKELRGEGRDRSARTIEEFAGEFTLVQRSVATSSADLDAAAVQDVLVSIYRPIRKQAPEAMRLTFSFDLLLFHPKRS